MVIIFSDYAFTAFAYGKNREITFWKQDSQALSATPLHDYIDWIISWTRDAAAAPQTLALYDNRELKQRRRRRQRERQKKAIGFSLAKKQLCTCTTQFCTFLRRDFTFCGGPEHKTTTLFFFFWSLIQSFRVQLQKKSPTFDELIEMEYTRLSLKPRQQFLTEVFVAVAVVIT